MIAKHQRLLSEISSPILSNKIGLSLPPEYLKGSGRKVGSKNKKTIERESNTQRQLREQERVRALEQLRHEQLESMKQLKEYERKRIDDIIKRDEEERQELMRREEEERREYEREQKRLEALYHHQIKYNVPIGEFEPSEIGVEHPHEIESFMAHHEEEPSGISKFAPSEIEVKHPEEIESFLEHYKEPTETHPDDKDLQETYDPDFDEQHTVTSSTHPNYFNLAGDFRQNILPNLYGLYNVDSDANSSQQFLDDSDDEPDNDYTGIMNNTVKQAITNELVKVSTELSKALANPHKTTDNVKKIRELTTTQKRLTTLLAKNEQKKVKEYYANSYPDLSNRFNGPQFFPKKYNKVQPPPKQLFYPKLNDAVLKLERHDVNGFSDYDFTHSKLPADLPMPYIPTQALNTIVSAPIDKLPNVKLSVKYSNYVYPEKTCYDTLMNPIDKLPLR